MNYFVHEKGICESQTVGENTKVWAFAHVLKNAQIGKDCNICDHVFIENDVIIGDRVTIKCGVQIWDGLHIEDDVFIGPNVTFTNDKFPRSKIYPEKFSRTLVCKGASIGANATILPGITINNRAMVGAGSVVTRDVPPNTIVVGNPARIVGYVKDNKANIVEVPKNISEHKQPYVQGVEIHKFPVIQDLRGDLSFGEFEKVIPFLPKRYFLIFNVPGKEIRGEHAHRKCIQYLICVKGSVAVTVDDGVSREKIILDSPSTGLLLNPMVWGIQSEYSHDAVLLVFTSEYYDPADYVRDYNLFIKEKGLI